MATETTDPESSESSGPLADKSPWLKIGIVVGGRGRRP